MHNRVTNLLEVVPLSMTRTAEEQATTSATPSPIPTKPRRRAVITQIRKETGISQKKANIWLNWLLDMVSDMRSAGETTHYLSVEEMQERHAVLDIVVPDDATAEPGSAHDLTQRFVLDEGSDEVALTHSRDSVFDAVYCSVTVSVLSIGA